MKRLEVMGEKGGLRRTGCCQVTLSTSLAAAAPSRGMSLIADHAHNNVACEAGEFRQPAGFDASSNWPR